MPCSHYFKIEKLSNNDYKFILEFNESDDFINYLDEECFSNLKIDRDLNLYINDELYEYDKNKIKNLLNKIDILNLRAPEVNYVIDGVTYNLKRIKDGKIYIYEWDSDSAGPQWQKLYEIKSEIIRLANNLLSQE